MLSKTQRERYTRNVMLNEIGEVGQKKLLNSRVLVIGAGGLGSSAIYYLSASGIGNIGIVDDDLVELSNLQRQIIHNENDLGKKKIVSAREKINIFNKDTKVDIYNLRVNQDNLSKLVINYDYILDSTDNFKTRFIINEVCLKLKKILIFAAVKGFYGQVSTFKSFKKKNPCYVCFNRNDEETEEVSVVNQGILGSVAGTIGAIQATTTIKEILLLEESLVGKFLIFNFLNNSFKKIFLNKNPSCILCSDKFVSNKCN